MKLIQRRSQQRPLNERFRQGPCKLKDCIVEKFECEVLFRPTSDELTFLPEGPIDCGGGRFSWVAIQHGADTTIGSLNLFDINSGENITHKLPGRPGFAFPTGEPNEFIVGMERQLGLFNAQSGQWETLCDGVDKDVEGTIINDGTTLKSGVIFGCKDLQFKDKKAGLYFWRKHDKQLFPLRHDQTCSNGKVMLDEDDQHVTFLDIDTPTKLVVEYSLNVESGELSESKVILDLNDANDFPDGMVATPDKQGVIIAFYNPNPAPHGEARQYQIASGNVEAIWKTPQSPQVTCPLLIQLAGRTKLVLTTAVEHMTDERRAESVNAGCLFISDTPW